MMRVLESAEEFVSAVSGPLVLHRWRGPTSPRGIRALEQAVAVSAETRLRVAALICVEAHAPTPDAEARSHIASLMTTYQAAIGAVALVHYEEGFRASAVRGVVTGLLLLSKPPFPFRVFAEPRDALAWLASTVRLQPTTMADGRTFAKLEASPSVLRR